MLAIAPESVMIELSGALPTTAFPHSQLSTCSFDTVFVLVGFTTKFSFQLIFRNKLICT